MILRSEGSPDARRYNRPTTLEIGVLIVGGDDGGSNGQPKNRDIVLHLKGPGNDLTRINEIHQRFDPLQYVLMFPFGDPGWHINLKSYNSSIMETDIDASTEDTNQNTQKSSTIMQYYSSRLMIREGYQQNLPREQQISLHSFGKLFHQYIVDMYAKMEQQRLNYIRFNQDLLRAAV